jgi:hypothetical protein
MRQRDESASAAVSGSVLPVLATIDQSVVANSSLGWLRRAAPSDSDAVVTRQLRGSMGAQSPTATRSLFSPPAGANGTVDILTHARGLGY